MGGNHGSNGDGGLACGIHACECGGAHLHMGPMSLHLTPESLLALDDAIHRFAQRVRGPRAVSALRLARVSDSDLH